MEKYEIVDSEIKSFVSEAWFASVKGRRNVLFVVDYSGYIVGMKIYIQSIKWDNKYFFSFQGKFIPDDDSNDHRVWRGCYNLRTKKGFIRTDEKL